MAKKLNELNIEQKSELLEDALKTPTNNAVNDLFYNTRQAQTFQEFKKAMTSSGFDFNDALADEELKKKSYQEKLKRGVSKAKSLAGAANAKLVVTQAASIGKMVLEDSLMFNAIKSRSIEKQSRTKALLTSANQALSLATTAFINVPLAIVQVGIMGYQSNQKRAEELFEIEQENLGKDLQRVTLGNIRTKRGR